MGIDTLKYYVVFALKFMIQSSGGGSVCVKYHNAFSSELYRLSRFHLVSRSDGNAPN